MTAFACEVDAAVFARVLAQVMRARSTLRSVEVLRGVKLDAHGGALVLSASDMSMSMRAPVPAGVTVEGAAVLADPAACLALVKTLEGPLSVAFEASEDTKGRDAGALVVVSWTGARYSFAALPVEDFPAWPELGGDSGTIDRAAFVSVLGRVLPVAGKDESRPVLCGVMLTIENAPERGRFQAVATDSYRLAVDCLSDVCEGGRFEQVVTGSMLAEVVKVAKVKGAPDVVGWAASNVPPSPMHVGFTVGDVEIVGRRIDGQYPNWSQLRPDSWAVEASMSAVELKAATKRLAAVVGNGGRNIPARLTVDVVTGAVSLRIVNHDGGAAEETLPTPAVVATDWPDWVGDYPAPEVRTMPEVGFHAKFLADAADFCGDTVRLRLLSPLRPAVFLNGRDDAWHLLMPIRLGG